ncbi:Down syndrome cell adhesion molecule-like protein 1 homolog [Puntigrus tetrazona]|uniref:Down syndrome cell adhesion molecule-like protein 1 homolog n=1 Tax=Puntigrus tetrazona TaxID=1606681 RepID=UPI001C8963BF|nr:Down syndrome cell adhesion molecule-like protein 1 homolog [Puntigrus tetrazona]XP_043096277.1 Down syndrome cell adhesion molecule-like protein 1 homolog [Puntigrus tetrazona]
MKRASMSRPAWTSVQMLCSLWLLLLCSSIRVHPAECELVFSVSPEDGAGVLNSSLMLNCTVFDSGLKAPLPVKWKRDAGGLDTRIHQLANGSLFFPNLKEEDFGNYSCSAKRGNKQVQTTVMVSKAYLEDVFFHPQSMRTEEGRDVFLQCVSGESSPPAQISWLKNGRVLTKGSQIQGQYGGGSQRKTSGTLHMANITKADQGVYICITHNPLLNISKGSQAATLTVHGSNVDVKIIEGPQNLTVPAETEATLHCFVEGFPIPTVQWFKDGHPLPNSSRWHLQKDGQLLIFQKVLSEDEGLYFCEAHNERQKVISEPAYLLPAVMDWIFVLEPANLTVRKGESATLSCRPPHSRPQAQVSWFKNNRLLQRGPYYTFDPTGDLVFHSVQETDSGLYFCRAFNSHLKRALSSKKIFLDVLEPPSVTIWPMMVTSPVGAEVAIHCQVLGHPAPFIKWSKQGRSVLTGGKIIKGLRNTTLYISSVRTYDEGHYTCAASNTLGHDQKTMTLRIAVKPVIVSFLASLTVSEGSPVSLPCWAVGDFPVKYTWIRTASIQTSPEQSGSNSPVSLPQQMHTEDNGTLVIPNIHRSDAGEYHCTAENTVGQDVRSLIITVTAHSDVPPDKEALSNTIMPTVPEIEQELFTNSFLYGSKLLSNTEINESPQQTTGDYAKISLLHAFVEDSPTYLNLESTHDTTEFISLKPSHISIGSNEKIKQPSQTQKPTPVPVKPTPFLALKETFNQDLREHVQPTEQATKPPVINPNTNSPSSADSYSHTHLKKNLSFSLKSAQSFSGQTQTTGLMDVENFNSSAPVEKHQNQSIKQAGGTKSSVTNDTDLVETLKKNTSQAPMRTTDNNNREKEKSQTWLPVIEKHDIPIVVGVGVSLAFIFVAMAFYSLVQKNDPAAVPTGRSALRGIGGPCRHGERLAMERTYDNKAFEDDTFVAVIEQSPNTSETRALPIERRPSKLMMEPPSDDLQEGVQSNQDMPVIVETHPEPREEDQLETIFEEGKVTPSPHSDIQLQCMEDWRSQDAPSPPPANPAPAQEEGLRSSLTLQTSDPSSTPVRHSINISHGFSPLLLSHCVSLGMTSVAVDVHFYPSAPPAAGHPPCPAFGPAGQQVNTRLEHELNAPSASHSK